MADETGPVVRRLRLRAGLTQEGLAERSGVSVRTIRGIETGNRRNPQLASLAQLADALELSPDDRHDLLGVLGAATPSVTARLVPRQLPAAPRGFAGRARELAALQNAADTAADDSRGAVITVIAGAGGIGKTWLALRWAHDHLDWFPDGQLFIDLRGFSPDGDPMDPLAVVRRFLAALGVDPAEMIGGLDELSALYRSRVAGRRMLIVLDNTANADQVTPLLPGTAGCAVLITSRQTLTALLHRYGAHHVRLELLDEDDAYTLLAYRLGHKRLIAELDATAALIRSCGRYPLALSLVASRAQANSDVPVGEFVAELRETGLDALDDADPTASLPDVLSWSLNSLTDEQRRVFALLGIVPGVDISLHAAAHLIDLPQPQARKILRQLEDASLLTRRAYDRYLLHDLVRGYAATTAHNSLTNDEIETALQRVLEFYLHTACAADLLLNPHGPTVEIDPPASGVCSRPLADVAAALAWFDIENVNLLATLQAGNACGRHRSVWQLAGTLNTFHRRRASFHDLLAVRRTALDAATHLGEYTARILAHRRLGRTLAELGRHEEAIHHLRQALTIAERHDDLSEQAHIHRMLALTHGLRADHRQALDHATVALHLYRAVDNSAWEADARNQVGWHTAHLGDYANAHTHSRAALAMHHQHGNGEGAADALNSLGYIAHHTGHHQQAIDHYQNALSAYRALGNTRLATDTLARLGQPYAALCRHDQARVVWNEAVELYRRNGHAAAADYVQHQLDSLHHSSDKPHTQPLETSTATPAATVPAKGLSHDLY